MNETRKTIRKLRNEQYSYNINLYPYINNWKKNPYTFIKAKFYMETSAILVWLLLKTNIKPNSVTVLYGLAGILTGILLSIPNNIAIIIGLAIAFSKGILDWIDGHFARITEQTSLTGHILDIYGAHLNSLGLQSGLGMYVAYRADTLLFYYLVPLLLFFRAGSIIRYSKAILFEEISSENNVSLFQDNDSQGKNQDNININSLERLYSKYKNLFIGFLDDRARSVDLICLIILLEIVFPINISWIFFLLIVVKYFIIFVASIYIIGKGGWVENEMMNKLRVLNDVFQKKQ
tara:strand:- start:1357 stop:2229 length:873 start_codon:yes stop_codon:yes gene_type:complete